MNEFIGKGKITNGIDILIAIVVIAVIGESGAQSMVVIQHGSYSVETESIKFKFFEPIFAIGEEKMQNFVLAVIETKRVPSLMVSAIGVAMKI